MFRGTVVPRIFWIQLHLTVVVLGSNIGVAAAKAVIVLDPGHGGSNLGAAGPTEGIHEKELTLTIANHTQRALSQALVDSRVVLTRTADTYLTLRQRVGYANRLSAAVFVSIHLNASPDHARRGFEVYTLAPEVADREGKRIADLVDVGSLAGKSLATQAVLVELRQAMALRGSFALAKRIAVRLTALRGRSRHRPLRQGGFDVLKGLHMPGVLVELGFIDHPQEGRELRQRQVQLALARSLSQAIVDYLTSR